MVLLIITGFFVFSAYKTTDKKSPLVNIANPAATFCVEQGGESEIRTNEDGSQYGVCIIDGQEYDDWEYFRNNNED